MRFAGITDKGRVRQKNEDNYKIITDYEDKPSFFIIADGMGGHSSGEIASRIAIDMAENHIKNSSKSLRDKVEIFELINIIINDADKEIQENALLNEETIGMGTTFIIMGISDDTAYIGHIGDSRVYLVNNEGICRITTDHSYVEELLKSGSITKRQAENHPKKNLITKALGHIENDHADFYKVDLKENDTLIMCTDGLSNKITEDDMLNEVIVQDKPYEICRNLVDMANQRGGEDNITAIIVKNID